MWHLCNRWYLAVAPASMYTICTQYCIYVIRSEFGRGSVDTVCDPIYESTCPPALCSCQDRDCQACYQACIVHGPCSIHRTLSERELALAHSRSLWQTNSPSQRHLTEHHTSSPRARPLHLPDGPFRFWILERSTAKLRTPSGSVCARASHRPRSAQAVSSPCSPCALGRRYIAW